jgi:hypothetical protein
MTMLDRNTVLTVPVPRQPDERVVYGQEKKCWKHHGPCTSVPIDPIDPEDLEHELHYCPPADDTLVDTLVDNTSPNRITSPAVPPREKRRTIKERRMAREQRKLATEPRKRFTSSNKHVYVAPIVIDLTEPATASDVEMIDLEAVASV